MAGFTVGNPDVNRRIWPSSRRRKKTRVTSRALPHDRHAAVKACWRPRSKAAAMAGVAVSDDHARQRLIRNMRRGARVSWRIGTAVTGQALVVDDNLSVVEP